LRRVTYREDVTRSGRPPEPSEGPPSRGEPWPVDEPFDGSDRGHLPVNGFPSYAADDDPYESAPEPEPPPSQNGFRAIGNGRGGFPAYQSPADDVGYPPGYGPVNGSGHPGAESGPPIYRPGRVNGAGAYPTDDPPGRPAPYRRDDAAFGRPGSYPRDGAPYGPVNSAGGGGRVNGAGPAGYLPDDSPYGDGSYRPPAGGVNGAGPGDYRANGAGAERYGSGQAGYPAGDPPYGPVNGAGGGGRVNGAGPAGYQANGAGPAGYQPNGAGADGYRRDAGGGRTNGAGPADHRVNGAGAAGYPVDGSPYGPVNGATGHQAGGPSGYGAAAEGYRPGPRADGYGPANGAGPAAYRANGAGPAAYPEAYVEGAAGAGYGPPREQALRAVPAYPVQPEVSRRGQPPADPLASRSQTVYPAYGDAPAGPGPGLDQPRVDEATEVLRRYVPANELLTRETEAGNTRTPTRKHPTRAIARRRARRRRALEWPFLVAFALVAAFLIRTFAVQTFYIPSGSMHETLLEGDRVLVNKVGYHMHDVHRGDVIVFHRPPNFQVEDEDLIKRVIALPGETVQGVGRKVLVNGKALNEPYVEPACNGTDPFPPLTVPAGHLWVMGDNRCDSSDSRVFGPIDRGLVVGRAFVLAWPPGRIAWL
jgi:signal peptidase I